jgi:cell division protein FtsI (penicillin-binding protein 3)
MRVEATRDRARAAPKGGFWCWGWPSSAPLPVVGGRMGILAASEPQEPRAAASGAAITALRADITDRNGRLLATNMMTHALYAHPRQMIDPGRVARELAAIFPDIDAADLERRFTDGRSFMWLRRVLSPEQQQLVHEIGDPGLLFGPREMRLYPNGSLAAHVLGGASFGAEGVHSAEIVGTAGIEKALDARLRDPALASQPLALSLDLTLQAATAEILDAGKTMMNAKGATAILMDARTGEILSLVSLPDFDPNDRPNPLVKGDPGDSPLFNRAVQGVYELGSTFKIFATAQAMDLGLVNADTMVDAARPDALGPPPDPRIPQQELRPQAVGDGCDRAVVERGHGQACAADRRSAPAGLLQVAGLFRADSGRAGRGAGRPPPDPREMARDRDDHHLLRPWHVGQPDASGRRLCAIANGGVMVKPTLLKNEGPVTGVRVMSPETARARSTCCARW